MKILLLEDELHLQQNIKAFLERKEHEVVAFEDGQSLLDSVNVRDFNCMILDINTPYIDGFELLEYIRTNDISTPALFISALTDTQKVLKAFNLGAQDYLKKPFDLLELEARLMRLNPDQTTNSRVSLGGDISYNPNNRTLYKNEEACKLSSTQKRLLWLLYKNKNNLVTFDAIIEYVWDDKEIAHATIISTVRNLKKLLPKECLVNIKGEGYTLKT